jgi:hypothetical protein
LTFWFSIFLIKTKQTKKIRRVRLVWNYTIFMCSTLYLQSSHSCLLSLIFVFLIASHSHSKNRKIYHRSIFEEEKNDHGPQSKENNETINTRTSGGGRNIRESGQNFSVKTVVYYKPFRLHTKCYPNVLVWLPYHTQFSLGNSQPAEACMKIQTILDYMRNKEQ